MVRRLHSFTIVALLLTLSAFIGCGGSQPKIVPVSGTVRLNEQPLAEGVIFFKTVETGAFERFDIKDGAFKGMAAIGNRRVEISSFVNKPREIDGKMVDYKENVIPASYNTDSKFTALVTAEGPNEFTFEMTKK